MVTSASSVDSSKLTVSTMPRAQWCAKSQAHTLLSEPRISECLLLYTDWLQAATYTTFDPSKVAGGTRTSCVLPSPPHVHTPPPSVRAILEETPHVDMISARAMRNYKQKPLGNHVLKSAKSTLSRITIRLGATDTSNPQMSPRHVLFTWAPTLRSAA